MSEDGQQRAERLLELIASGDASEEAQAEFDRLLTPELHAKLANAVLKRRERSAKDQNESTEPPKQQQRNDS